MCVFSEGEGKQVDEPHWNSHVNFSLVKSVGEEREGVKCDGRNPTRRGIRPEAATQLQAARPTGASSVKQ